MSTEMQNNQTDGAPLMQQGSAQTSDQTRPTLERVEDTLHQIATDTREELKKPTTGAAIAGGLAVAATMVLGWGEALVAAGTAYVVYRTLRRRQRVDRLKEIIGPRS